MTTLFPILRISLLNGVAEAEHEEPGPVLVFAEDVGLVYSPDHDEVQGARDVEAGLAWHGGMLTKAGDDVKPKAR